MRRAVKNPTTERDAMTDARARKIAAPKQGYILIPDAGRNAARGLLLRITRATKSEPNGARAWVFSYYTISGQQRRPTIGRIEAWPIEAARKKARAWRQLVDDGGDPLKERQDERAAETMDQLCDRFKEEHLPRLRESSRESYEVLLRKWIRPALGKSRVKDIAYPDIDKLHRQITAAGRSHTANRAVAVLSKMFNLAIRENMRADNPVKGVERNPEQPRQRYLNGEELGQLMEALAKHPNNPSANAIRLLLLTGARRNEVLGATFDQFDLKEGVWTKPSSHTKQKKEHRVPLSAPARQIVADMLAREKAAAKKAKREPSPYLFPARGHPDATQRSLKKFWSTVSAEAGLAGVRVHDLRHSFASSLAGAGLSLPIIGALLGHTQPMTTARYAHLADAALRAATETVGRAVEAASPSDGADRKEGGAEVPTLRP